MLSFTTCARVPEEGGRWYGGGGLVEVEGKAVWGAGQICEQSGLFVFDEVKSEWSRVADGGEFGSRLAVCGGRLVWVGGCLKEGVYAKKVMELREGRWSLMSDMLIGCAWSCVLSVGGGGMVVMGGAGDGGRDLNDVQVFDGMAHTWHRGPSLPQPCHSMSAVVHGDLVFAMGGAGMDKAVWCADIHDLTTAQTHDSQQSIWTKLPDVPYYCSSVCMVDGVLLAFGGAEGLLYGSKNSPAIYGFHCDDQKWNHVGDLPLACSWVDTLLLSGGRLLMVDGSSTQQVLKIAVEGLAKLFRRKADKWYGEYVGTVIRICIG